MMFDHNVEPGSLKHCQVCASSSLDLVIDLGHQPLCDTLLTKEQLDEPEIYYPLRLLRCPICTLVQLDYVVPGSVVYHQHYPYRTGITKELKQYQHDMAKTLTQRYQLDNNSLVVDIGSNDGTLLEGFKQQGVNTLGVEPTNIATIAQAAGIDTIQDFFNERIASDIVAENGNPALVTTSNVFAHMARLGDVIRGIQMLIGKKGVFVLENHYLIDVLQKVQYDTVYHEHIRTYSLKSLITLFDYYDLEIFHAERVSRYGGNIRAHIAKKGAHSIEGSVGKLLKLERQMGLDKVETYRVFRNKVEQSRWRLLDLIVSAAHKDLRLVGNSCPGRANTILHYCDINVNLMPYIAEQSTSLKKGLYSPGKHIPILDNSILFEEQPDIVILLAWHYAQPIATQLRQRGLTSKLIQPLPNCVEVCPC